MFLIATYKEEYNTTYASVKFSAELNIYNPWLLFSHLPARYFLFKIHTDTRAGLKERQRERGIQIGKKVQGEKNSPVLTVHKTFILLTIVCYYILSHID